MIDYTKPDKEIRDIDPPNLPPPPPPPPPRFWIKRIETREFIIVFSSLLLIFISCLYFISRDGMFGLSQAKWNIVWVISENGVVLLFSVLSGIYFLNLIRYVFRWVITPLYIVKIVYQFSCFTGVYLFHPDTWKTIWEFICVGVVFVGIMLLIKKFTQK